MTRIYLSSTYADLVAEREAVYRALRRLGHDVVAMEDYVAADARPADRCLADVRSCNVYVGVFAWRYGYVVPEHGRSITELEFQEARRLGKPCLIFLLHEDASWPRSRMDRDLSAIESLRERFAREHLVSLFRTPDELASQATVAVASVGPEPGASDLQIADDVILHVTALSRRDSPSYKPSNHVLEYRTETLDGVVEIKPIMEYLSDYERGGPIEAIDDLLDPFDWDFPNLDVKVVNNSDRTIFLTDAVFNVNESCLDPSPVLLLGKDSARTNALHLLIKNEGWGDVRSLQASFHLTPVEDTDSTARFDEPFPYEVTVKDFTEQCNVNISSAFERAGVDFDSLESLRVLRWGFNDTGSKILIVRNGLRNEVVMTEQDYEKKLASYLGPFQQGGAIVSGVLEFGGFTPTSVVRRRVKFLTEVWIFNLPPASGAPVPPSYQYSLKFLFDGTNYERRVPVSHVLKPQEADRFNIRIAMDRSSRHRFGLKLLYNNGAETEVQEISLTTFVPRSVDERVYQVSDTHVAGAAQNKESDTYSEWEDDFI